MNEEDLQMQAMETLKKVQAQYNSKYILLYSKFVAVKNFGDQFYDETFGNGTMLFLHFLDWVFY